MFPRCLGGKGQHALHPGPENTEQDRQIRQAPLQTPQPHRDHVRPPQGLEAGRNTLRSVPEGLLLRRRPRRNRHLLALINEMGWLPPSLTTSRCASVVLVQATNGKDGNSEFRIGREASRERGLQYGYILGVG